MIDSFLWMIAIFAITCGLMPLFNFSLFWYEAINTGHWDKIKVRYNLSGWSILLKIYLASVLSLCRSWINWPMRFYSKYWYVPSSSPSHIPVVFVHGFLHNRSAWVFYMRLFRKAGLSHLYSVDLKGKFSSIENLAQQLSKEIDVFLASCGAKQVDIVAHSMGGIISRYYIQKLGGTSKVRKIVTLGSPHRGTKLAAFMLGKARNELLPGSSFWESLKDDEELFFNGREISVFYSDSDFMILPPSNSRFNAPGVRNISVGLLSHLGFLYKSKIANEVLNILQSNDGLS